MCECILNNNILYSKTFNSIRFSGSGSNSDRHRPAYAHRLTQQRETDGRATNKDLHTHTHTLFDLKGRTDHRTNKPTDRQTVESELGETSRPTTGKQQLPTSNWQRLCRLCVCVQRQRQPLPSTNYHTIYI